MFDIARPPRYHLERSPLAWILVQVRFPLVAHFQELAGIASVQDRLLDRFPYVEREQLQTVSLTVGPTIAAPAAPESMVRWRFTADDHWAFVLEPGSAALCAGGEEYHGIDDFAARYSDVLDALHATERIRRCDRIGIRYINIVETSPGDERAWSRWFRRELIGWIGADILGADTRLYTSITQSQLSAKPAGPLAGSPVDVHALIRHGVMPPGTQIPFDTGTARQLKQESYVIDLDLFIQALQPFDRAVLRDQFLALHTQIDAFFRWTLTEEGEKYFGLEEL